MSDDRDLVAAFLRRRDELAFRALYRRHTPYLFGLAHRLAGGSDAWAADIVEDTWVRASERLDTFGWQSKLRTWLGGILINCHREAVRRDGGRFDPLTDDTAPARPTDVGLRIDLEAALARLPRGYREVIVLYHVYGYTHREIGALLEIDEGTSKSQLARGRRRLREYLG